MNLSTTLIALSGSTYMKEKSQNNVYNQIFFLLGLSADTRIVNGIIISSKQNNFVISCKNDTVNIGILNKASDKM